MKDIHAPPRVSRVLRRPWRVTRQALLFWAGLFSLPTGLAEQDGAIAAWHRYPAATAMVALVTLVCWILQPVLGPVNISLLYLFPVLASAITLGLWPSFYAAGLGVLAFDFLFVPPLYTYTVSDFRYAISFGVLLAVGATAAVLTTAFRRQAQAALAREQSTAALLTVTRHMVEARAFEDMMDRITQHMSQTLGVPVSIILADNGGDLSLEFGSPTGGPPTGSREDIVRWVYRTTHSATFGERSATELMFLPLKTEQRAHGVLCIGDYGTNSRLGPEAVRLASAFAYLTAISVDRWQFQKEAELARLSAESERLRTALLDSLSHELQTPLTTIISAAATLGDRGDSLSRRDQSDLLALVASGAGRMDRLISNLLSMVRIESGMLSLSVESCDVEDIVGMALGQLKETVRARSVGVHVAPHAAAMGDPQWLRHVVANVISNALKYSPVRSRIDITGEVTGDQVVIAVRDQGTGIDAEQRERVFEKFVRGDNAKHIPGIGVGLAIAKAIVDAHHGTIKALANHPRGTTVQIVLPRAEAPPREDHGHGA